MHRDPGPPQTTEASPSSAGGGRTAAIGKILLIPGRVKVSDMMGHHDYLAGCRLLAFLLEQTAGVETVVGRDGWLTDEARFEDAQTVIFYAGGSRMKSILESPHRLERIEPLLLVLRLVPQPIREVQRVHCPVELVAEQRAVHFEAQHWHPGGRVAEVVQTGLDLLQQQSHLVVHL